MATRVTDGVSRLCRSRALTKPEEKERLLAVYDPKVRAASLRYRNRAVITVLMCEQSPYLV